jgi:hypothetical protein
MVSKSYNKYVWLGCDNSHPVPCMMGRSVYQQLEGSKSNFTPYRLLSYVRKTNTRDVVILTMAHNMVTQDPITPIQTRVISDSNGQVTLETTWQNFDRAKKTLSELLRKRRFK